MTAQSEKFDELGSLPTPKATKQELAIAVVEIVASHKQVAPQQVSSEDVYPVFEVADSRCFPDRPCSEGLLRGYARFAVGMFDGSYTNRKVLRGKTHEEWFDTHREAIEGCREFVAAVCNAVEEDSPRKSAQGSKTTPPVPNCPTDQAARTGITPSLSAENSSKAGNLEELWHEALNLYLRDDLREALEQRFPGDRNVQERISFEKPPVFQPGYVGKDYFSGRRLLLIGQNPGEGNKPEWIRRNREYMAQLASFKEGETSFEALNDFIAGEMADWDIFSEKGIFMEGGDRRLSLLERKVRPSLAEIAYVNAFPFKTRQNSTPLKRSALNQHIWDTYVVVLVRLLQPAIIVHFPELDRMRTELGRLCPDINIIRVYHPSDRNANSRRAALVESWDPLNRVLAEVP